MRGTEDYVAGFMFGARTKGIFHSYVFLISDLFQ